MSDVNCFIGVWKIVECRPETVSGDKKGIQGTIFQLTKTGDVTWKVPGDAASIPLFSCETYEVVRRGPFLSTLLRFGAYKGHVIEFRIETYKPKFGIIMIHEGFIFLMCKKLEEVQQEECVEVPFSLLPALEDSYFSDLSITASNDKQFPVHTSILGLSAPDIDWKAKPTPLSGLSEDVLGTVLHYLYAQCLPPELDEEVAKKVIAAAPDYSGLEPLVAMCQSYIKNLQLKRRIVGLIGEMHSCVAQVIDYFSGQQSKSLVANPVKLCHAVKSSIREAAVAGSKLLLLCDLYDKKRDEMSLEAGHEIIRYAKSRLPVFINQIERFLQGVRATFTSLLASQRQELACYLVPEMETILDTIASLLLKVKAFLEIMLADAEIEDEAASREEIDSIEQQMNNVLHEKELSRLRFLLHRITCVLMHLQQKKESFKAMTSGNKIRSVSRNLEHLIDRLPFFLLRLSEVADEFDEKFEWNESQFCFKVGTSKVSEILKNLLVHKEALQDLMVELCDLVQRDSFSQSLMSLGLLDPALGTAGNSSEASKKDGSSEWATKESCDAFNPTQYLCVSPPPQRNRLSKAAMQLLRTRQESDMVFEVIADADEYIGGEGSAADEAKASPEVVKIEAHRVIIAARCDWFRRALLSGMREDINRKIEVHNTSPFLFSLFLEYLYSGRLEYKSLTVEQLSELLLLSDRYELDSLKQACELGLKPHLDQESVLYFLSMADQFNAKILKSACLTFIDDNVTVMDTKLFDELPTNLQNEVYEVVMWGMPRSVYLSSGKATQAPYSVSDIAQMAANVHLNGRGELTRSENAEELPLTHDSARLEAAIEQLRDIVDPNISRSQLVQVILAADYDINRALNFYYSSS